MPSLFPNPIFHEKLRADFFYQTQMDGPPVTLCPDPKLAKPCLKRAYRDHSQKEKKMRRIILQTLQIILLIFFSFWE